MNTPYGLEIVENCQACKLKREECFCNLSPNVLKHFSSISHQTTFPADATLFVEGQNPRGVFLLCSGKVKLSTSSRDGKVLILKMAGAGEMLGLSAAIAGTEYELTAGNRRALPGELCATGAPAGSDFALWRSGVAIGASSQPRVSVGLPRHSRSDSGAIVGRQAGQALALVDAAGSQRSKGDPSAFRANSRRDGADDWSIPRDSYAVVERLEEETVDPAGGVDAGDSKSYSAGGFSLVILPL